MRKNFYINLTNGLGNNIFQIVASTLLFKDYKKVRFILIPPCENYYGLPVIKKLFGKNITLSIAKFPPKFRIMITDYNYKFFRIFSLFLKLPFNFFAYGYFEDYQHYINQIKVIKSLFTIKKYDLDEETLVLHLRTGDRLYYEEHEKYRHTYKEFKDLIHSFNYKEFFIVTDFPSLNNISLEKFKKLKFHIPINSSSEEFIERTVDYINSLFGLFNSKGAKQFSSSLYEEFCFLASSKKIIFENSTIAWWASFISSAYEIRLSKGWRPWKLKSNKNLSEIPFKNWITW